MGVQHGCMYMYVAMCVYFTHIKYVYIHVVCVCTQSWPSLCDRMVCSPPGSSVPEISQARILEWVAIFLLQGVFPTQCKPSSLASPALTGGFFYHCTTWEAHVYIIYT